MITGRVFLIIILLLLPGLLFTSTGILNAQTMGLYFDVDGTTMSGHPQAFTLFDTYLFIHDADYLVTAVEYQLTTPGDPSHVNFLALSVEYPDDQTVSLGDPFSGHSIAYWPPLNGFYPGYNLLCKITCITMEPCVSDGGSLLEYPLVIGPHPESGGLRGTYYPDNEFFDITGLWSFLCPSHWAPYIYDVSVLAPRAVELYISPCADEWNGNNPDNYRVYNAADPSDTLGVMKAVRHPYNSEIVTLFLDGPMVDGVDYIVWALACCDCHGCGESEYQYTYDEGSLPVLPDLAVEGLSGYHDIRALCAPYDFSYTVANWGLAPAGSFRVLASIYSWESGDYIEIPLDSLSHAGLGIDETLTEQVSFILPPEIKTYNYLRVRVDDLEQVQELTEYNNLGEASIWNYSPKILSVTDVPDDLGGWVTVMFSRSYADRLDFSEVTEYEILRRIDPLPGGPPGGYTAQAGTAAGRKQRGDLVPAGGSRNLLSSGDWEPVGQVPADCSEIYTTDVATAADSTEEYGLFWSVYKVRAVRPVQDTTFHYVSCPDSGYSVVNDWPIATLLQGFSAGCEGSGIEITWRLYEADAGTVFRLSRQGGGTGYFVELHGIEILRDGLGFSFRDLDVAPGETYRYRVEYIAGQKVHILFETEPVKIPEMRLTLYQNIPNPFNPATVIRYYLPEASRVVLEIFDPSGRRVCCLVDESENKGMHSVEWTGVDGGGSPASSGVYFYRLRAGKNVVSRKMILLK